MSKNPYAQYKQMQVTTTDPLRLVVMLYEGAITALKRAKPLIEQKEYEAKGKELLRAHDIIFELLAALDRERGGEVAENLEQLYVYMIRRILEANVSMDFAIIDEVIKLLDNLLGSWKILADQQNPGVTDVADSQTQKGKRLEESL